MRPKSKAQQKKAQAEAEALRLERAKIINEVARLMSGTTVDAKEFLRTLTIRDERFKRLSNDQLLSIIKKVRNKKDSEKVDAAILQMRKEMYGYEGDPDRIKIFFVPTGGKPNKY